jgi:hypothetical protein
LDGKPIKKEDVKTTSIVGGIGMASTLIRRDVVEAMCKKYDKPFEFQLARSPEGKGVYISEDLGFCYRANTLGFATWAVKGMVTHHMGDNNFYKYEG